MDFVNEYILKTKKQKEFEGRKDKKNTRLGLDGISNFSIIFSHEKRNAFDILNECQFFSVSSQRRKNAENVSVKCFVGTSSILLFDEKK